MHFDDILAGDVGEFGAYQKKIYFLLCLPSITSGFHMVISVFLLGTPKHRWVFVYYLYEKKVKIVMVNNSAIINKKKRIISRLKSLNRKRPSHTFNGNRSAGWRQKAHNVRGLNLLMGSEPSFTHMIIGSPTAKQMSCQQ